MAVFTLHYLPSIAYFQAIVQCEKIVLEQFDSFQKSTFRNKAIIATANGKLTLSIPVDGGRNNRILYKEVQIASNENWQHKHWMAIVSAYRNAPFFDFYADYFYPFFHQKYSHLYQFNLDLFQLLCKLMKISAAIEFSTDFSASNIVSLDKENQLILLPQNVRYIQVFEEKNGFISHLSVLDLIFNEGNKSKEYLLNIQ